MAVSDDKNNESSDISELSENESECIVDFEFFDPKEIDFHGIKSLLIQQFTTKSNIDFSELSQLIISQNAVGSTVKVDEGQDDPYALMTILNLETHCLLPCIQNVIQFIMDKESNEKVDKIIKSKCGWLISERLLNMPVQVTEPLLRMLLEEIKSLIADKQPFEFDYFVLFSKIYKQIDSFEDNDEPKPKKAKRSQTKSKSSCDSITFYFQPEEELFFKYSEYSFDFKLDQIADSKRAFQEMGIEPSRRIMIIPFNKLELIYEDLKTWLNE